MAEPKYQYKNKELQRAQTRYGDDMETEIKRFVPGEATYQEGGKNARSRWEDLGYDFGPSLSPELETAWEKGEYGPKYYHTGGDFYDEGRKEGTKDKYYLLKTVKDAVGENPLLAIELGFTEKQARKLPQTKKEAVKLLLDIKEIADTPGSAGALGIDLTESGMTPSFWKDESDKKLGREAYAYQGFEDDIKEYQDIERMESKIEPLKIRRTAEDKIMDGFIQQDNKYKMGQ
tara:strand:- start:108 stop:803 length:696 start_codon:yes stop_codon:yes gene_type:complete